MRQNHTAAPDRHPSVATPIYPVGPPTQTAMGRKKRSRSIVREFDAYFGTGTLDDWQRLCRDVGLTRDYPSITQCRKVQYTRVVSSRGEQNA